MPTESEILNAAQNDDNTGWCRDCGEERGGCEPDARDYTCDACGEHAVDGWMVWLGAA